MALGGYRPGSGSKKGSIKSGTKKKLELAEKIVGTGASPLEYLISLFRNEEIPRKERLDAAIAAAPYIHSKMPSVNINHNKEMTQEEWIKELQSDE